METTGGHIFSVDRAHSLHPSPQPTLLSGKKWQHFHIVLIFIAFLRGLSDFKWELPIISSTGGGSFLVFYLFFRKQSSIQQTHFYKGLGLGVLVQGDELEGAGMMVILWCGDGRV